MFDVTFKVYICRSVIVPGTFRYIFYWGVAKPGNSG